MIDGNLVPIIAIISGAVIAVFTTAISTVTKYKLRVEQIKADAMVRAEEVRARNQLEIEKLMMWDRTKPMDIKSAVKEDTSDNEAYLERRPREKERY